MNFNASSSRTTYLLAGTIYISACTSDAPLQLTTIADARVNKAEFIDNGKPGDSVGDILVFDQPLLDKQKKTIGTNSGICIRTRVLHSFQCQWTLTMQNGSIQVAGRESDEGASNIAIVGGTGIYTGIRGEMKSIKNSDGTFTQTLRYWFK